MDKRNIDEIEFTIFDTETTGLNPQSGDRIVEIAGIKFKGNERAETFQSLVNPGRPVSAAAFAVNGITQEMLRDAPPASEVIPKFLDFIGESCLCSYNAAFDQGFLHNELKLLEIGLPANAVADILKISRRLLPGLERYSLRYVADSLGIKNEQKHRALSDVELTLDVFGRLKEILALKGIEGFANFMCLFGINCVLLEDINNQRLARLQEAIDLQVRLKIKYLSGLATVSEREVIPMEIRQEKNRNYLVGHCCLRNEQRTFRVDGILHFEII
ncbi:MAG: exonuclease domain-containing protein [Candidatus Omnitrophica bacterium]|nr:exonuclease domain-containing protein [Candidatus Omnitrophota bacterium]MDD5552436.1 exonuclease domain-containing protein [Candidatus Omnitrophota bacterium]